MFQFPVCLALSFSQSDNSQSTPMAQAKVSVFGDHENEVEVPGLRTTSGSGDRGGRLHSDDKAQGGTEEGVCTPTTRQRRVSALRRQGGRQEAEERCVLLQVLLSHPGAPPFHPGHFHHYRPHHRDQRCLQNKHCKGQCTGPKFSPLNNS